MHPTRASRRVGPLGDSGQHQARRRPGRQVLGRVHRHVGPAVEHRQLDLLGEDALPADAVERLVGPAVALGADDDHLDLDAGVGTAEEPGDQVGLPAGQR